MRAYTHQAMLGTRTAPSGSTLRTVARLRHSSHTSDGEGHDGEWLLRERQERKADEGGPPAAAEVRGEAAEEQRGAERLGQIVHRRVDEPRVRDDEEPLPACVPASLAEPRGRRRSGRKRREPDGEECGGGGRSLPGAEDPAEPAVERVPVPVARLVDVPMERSRRERVDRDRPVELAVVAAAWNRLETGIDPLRGGAEGGPDPTRGKAVTSQPTGRSEGTSASEATTSASAPDASGTGRTRLVSERTIDLSILMPVYDERATVEQAIEAVLETELGASYELIVVDDGSRDGTRELLENGSWPEHVRLLAHDRNRGKGAAIRTGLADARGTFTTILDADLEYSPSDIPSLLEPLQRGDAQAVFGTRAFRSHSAYSFWYVVGNRAVTLVRERHLQLLDLRPHDRAQGDTHRSLPLTRPARARASRSKRRSWRAWSAAGSASMRCRSSTARAVARTGKKLTAVDGLRVVRTLLRCRLS